MGARKRNQGESIMAITITCPSCEAKLRVPDKLADKKIMCPKCGNPVIATDDSVQANEPGPVVLELAEPLEVEAVEPDEDEVPAGDQVRVLKRGKAHKKTSIWVYITAGFLGTALVVAVGAFFVALRHERREEMQKQAEFDARYGNRQAAIQEAERVILAKYGKLIAAAGDDHPSFSNKKADLDDKGVWHLGGKVRVVEMVGFDCDRDAVWGRETLLYEVELKWTELSTKTASGKTIWEWTVLNERLY